MTTFGHPWSNLKIFLSNFDTIVMFRVLHALRVLRLYVTLIVLGGGGFLHHFRKISRKKTAHVRTIITLTMT